MITFLLPATTSLASLTLGAESSFTYVKGTVLFEAGVTILCYYNCALDTRALVIPYLRLGCPNADYTITLLSDIHATLATVPYTTSRPILAGNYKLIADEFRIVGGAVVKVNESSGIIVNGDFSVEGTPSVTTALSGVGSRAFDLTLNGTFHNQRARFLMASWVACKGLCERLYIVNGTVANCSNVYELDSTKLNINIFG